VKKSIADKWIKALRSGKYKQTKGKLKGKVGYCCLGVLCEISGKDEFKSKGYLGSFETLPKEVVSWAGMKSRTGCFIINRDYQTSESLSNLNDSGIKFKEIARIIHKYYKEL